MYIHNVLYIYMYVYGRFRVDSFPPPIVRKLSWVSDSGFPVMLKPLRVRFWGFAKANFCLKPLGSYLLGNDYRHICLHRALPGGWNLGCPRFAHIHSIALPGVGCFLYLRDTILYNPSFGLSEFPGRRPELLRRLARRLYFSNT